MTQNILCLKKATCIFDTLSPCLSLVEGEIVENKENTWTEAKKLARCKKNGPTSETS